MLCRRQSLSTQHLASSLAKKMYYFSSLSQYLSPGLHQPFRAHMHVTPPRFLSFPAPCQGSLPAQGDQHVPLYPDQSVSRAAPHPVPVGASHWAASVPSRVWLGPPRSRYSSCCPGSTHGLLVPFPVAPKSAVWVRCPACIDAAVLVSAPFRSPIVRTVSAARNTHCAHSLPPLQLLLASPATHCALVPRTGAPVCCFYLMQNSPGGQDACTLRSWPLTAGCQEPAP